MHRARQTLSRTLALAAALAAAGCGNEFGATVSGTVTLDGSPVTPGFVTFAPDSGDGLPGTSDLGPDGSYTLQTNRKPGIAPGTYRASVQSFEPPDVPPGQRSFELSKPLVPEKYLQVTTSGLSYEVKSGANRIDIALTSSGP